MLLVRRLQQNEQGMSWFHMETSFSCEQMRGAFAERRQLNFTFQIRRDGRKISL